jgi:large subunit ribosomal protein L5
MSRLQEQYNTTIMPQLKEKLQLKNVMEVPRITKITLNMGVGEAIADRKVIEKAMHDMELIAGQKPLMRRARKSVASFKLREENPIGCKVTLRRERMYEFLDRLVTIAIPRIRDFRGLNPKSMDGRGNYSMGIQEQIVFAEIDYDRIDELRGMDITNTTNARTVEQGKALLEAFNFPFKK